MRRSDPGFLPRPDELNPEQLAMVEEARRLVHTIEDYRVATNAVALQRAGLVARLAESGLTQAQIARAMGVGEPQVSRLIRVGREARLV